MIALALLGREGHDHMTADNRLVFMSSHQEVVYVLC